MSAAKTKAQGIIDDNAVGMFAIIPRLGILQLMDLSLQLSSASPTVRTAKRRKLY